MKCKHLAIPEGILVPFPHGFCNFLEKRGEGGSGEIVRQHLMPTEHFLLLLGFPVVTEGF
jgi:hypothetical protein